MRIRHNISSLHTKNKLEINREKTKKSLEKLSSGFKINRAGDDAAGLAISEKMRGQIRGLNIAGKNIQDGISLIQTAESGLSNIQDPNLQRLRELAIQSSNDSLTDADRQLIQKEVEQIKQGINDIANNTEFNGINLLNNTVELTQVTKEAGYEWEVFETGFSKLISGVIKYGEKYLATGADGNILSSLDGDNWDIINVGVTRNFYDIISNGSQLVAFGDGILFTSNDGINWNKQNPPMLEGYSNYQINNGIWDGSEFKLVTDKGHTLSSANGINWIESPIANGVFFKDITYNGNIYVSVGTNGNLATSNDGISWIQRDSKTTEDLNGIEWLDNKFVAVGLNGTLISSVDGINWNLETPLDTYRFDTISKSNNSFIIGGLGLGSQKNFYISSDGKQWESLDVINNSTLLDIEYDSANNEFIATTYDGKFLRSKARYNTNDSLDKINLQIGANYGEGFAIDLSDVRTTKLGIDNIDLSTRSGAETAISKIDEAIAKVSLERGKFGAYQNRLEHNYSNVMNSSENLQSAESRIRDADIAKEMMTFTKNNILMQASQAMLAQANEQPNSVLQLLQ
ncbi:flagellin [Lysinibacillus fusiformis]|uniref:flagellin N-terminal helical domain-containing protein n=1 Tax=Lysinibacillus fusiformis TaxID=28031 RepID=UPI00215B71BD|nr:flagellin [Lysinibacillus fusiformis]MCR8854918.1 flagellin [Lysinibacillus fusiformis]WKT79189.1 flagellin [Lysinibacillus fusiformis]